MSAPLERLRRAFSYLLNPRSNTQSLATVPHTDDAVDLDATPQGAFDGGLRPHHFLHNPALLLGLILTGVLLVIIIAGPLWVPYDPFVSTQTMLPHFDAELGQMVRPPLPPSAENPLGTDEYGNDMLSLIVYGARVTLVAAAYITLARLLLGALLGSLAGWRPGQWLDRLIMNLVGIVASVPVLLSSMILIYALDIRKGVVVFVAALAITGWTETAEYVRSEILVLRNLPYVEGARALGLSEPQIVVRHILPNLLPRLLILTFLEMGAVLILVAELGFLDVYIGGGSLFTMDPSFGGTVRLADVPEWGALVARGAPSLRANAHLVLGPAMAFFLAIVGMNALGEGLRRLLERAAFSTAFLLKRRTILAAALFLLLSRLALQLTGPEHSYARVAAAFDAGNVAAHMAAIDAAAGEMQDVRGVDFPVGVAAAYIQAELVAQEVLRGWKPDDNINQTYFYTEPGAGTPTVKAVMGFLSGYDTSLATELIVLLAPYDEQGGGDASGVALMLESARLWREQNVDPRRSLLLVAWNGDFDEAQAFLSDPQLFTFLPSPTRAVPRPAMLVRLDNLASGGEPLLLHQASDETLSLLFAASARHAGTETAPGDFAPAPAMGDLPAIALRWTGAAEAEIQQANLQRAGELLNHALLRLTRLPAYTP